MLREREYPTYAPKVARRAPVVLPSYTVRPQDLQRAAVEAPPARLPGYASELEGLPEGVSFDTPAPAKTPYEVAEERYRQILGTPAVDENGRPMSALLGLAQGSPEDARNNSLGYLIGARLGRAASSLIRPEQDEERKKAVEVQKAQGVMQSEAALDKERRAREAHEAEVKLREAQAKNTEALPGYRDAERRRKEEEGGKRLEQLERRLDITDAYNQGRLGQGERRLTETERRNLASEEDRDADRESKEKLAEDARKSREKVAQWQIGARKQIAAASQAIQRDRVKMSADQFSKRYPGAGKYVSSDALVQKYNQLKKADPLLTLDKVMADAVKQGYAIQD